MMKSCLFIPLLLLYSCFTSFSQVFLPPAGVEVDSLTLVAHWKAPESVVLSETFEEDLLPPGWQRSSLGQGWDTAHSATMGYLMVTGRSRFMITNDGECAPGNDGCCDYLVSPEMDLSLFPGYKLSFSSFFTGNYRQQARVEISTDGGQNWSELKRLTYSPVWQKELIDLSAYSGPGGFSQVMIAFHADDQGGQASGWAIDDVTVSSSNTGVLGYQLFLGMVYLGETTDTLFQIEPPLSYRHSYQLRVAAVYPSGNSTEVFHPFTSWYLWPPQDFTAAAFTDYILFSWEPPAGASTLNHYNLYVGDDLYATIPAMETSFAIPCENGEICARLTAVHDLVSFGYPCQMGESAPVEACGFIDTSLEFPLFDDFSSGSFSTNQWTAGPSWSINPGIGIDPPAAAFQVPTSPGTYESSLTTWYYDATQYSPCDAGGIIHIGLSFQLLCESSNLGGVQKFQVQVVTEDGVTVIREYLDDGLNEWQDFHQEILSRVAGHYFRIRLVALGESDGTTAAWYVDNVLLYWAISDNTYPMVVTAHRTGNPENDILVSWEFRDSNHMTYVLDDNSSEDQSGLNQPGERWLGNTFPVNESGVLQKAYIFMTPGTGASTTYSIDIFDENRNLAGSSFAFTPSFNEWTSIPLPDIPYNGTFYAMLHIQSSGHSDFLALDTNGPNAPGGYAWQLGENGWSQVPQSGVFLLRVLGLAGTDEPVSRASTGSEELECDTLGYSVYRRAYSAYPPGNRSGMGDYEWIGCSTKDVMQYLDRDLSNDLYNCYEYSVAVIRRNWEYPPSGNDWDCIFVGIPESLPESNLRVYPNPAGKLVRIEGSGPFDKVLVYSSDAKLCCELKDPFILDVTAFSPGLYLLKMTGDDGRVQTAKLLVRH